MFANYCHTVLMKEYSEAELTGAIQQLKNNHSTSTPAYQYMIQTG